MSTFQRKYVNEPNLTTMETQAEFGHKEEERISKSQSFDELKAWACPKAISQRTDWYMVCINCSGVETCKAGKRAIELLDQQTKPVKDESIMDKEAMRLTSKKGVCETIAKAFESGKNPIAYIMNLEKRSYTSVRSKIYNAATSYPDLEKKYHIFDWLKANQKRPKAYNDTIKEKTRNAIIAAFESGENPFDYIMRTEKKSYKSARAKIYTAANAYPDLEEKYHIFDFLAKNQKRPIPFTGKKSKQDDLSDEISIGDFLNEMTVESELKSKPEEIIQVEEKEEPKHVDEDVKIMDDKNRLQIVCEEMSSKRHELYVQSKKIEQYIHDYNEQLKQIKEQIESLDAVAVMFGLRPKTKME